MFSYHGFTAIHVFKHYTTKEYEFLETFFFFAIFAYGPQTFETDNITKKGMLPRCAFHHHAILCHGFTEIRTLRKDMDLSRRFFFLDTLPGMPMTFEVHIILDPKTVVSLCFLIPCYIVKGLSWGLETMIPTATFNSA